MFRRTSTRCTDRVVGPFAAMVVAGVIASCGTGGAEAAPAARAFVVAAAPAAGSTPATSTSTSTSTSASTSTSTSTSSSTTATTVAPTTTSAAPATVAAPAPTPAPVGGGAAYCLGDSVMLAAGPALFDELDACGVVDAVESRQVRNAAPATRQAASSGAPVVVVHLGTNGPFTASQLDAALAPLAGVPRVVLVTIQTGGRAHQATVNAELRAAPARHPNVRLADFEAASAGQPGLFAGDGIHLMRSGAQLYARVIAEAAA